MNAGERASTAPSWREAVTRELSMLELAVVIAVVALLVAVGVERMRSLMASVERASVVAIENEIRSGLMLVAATRLVNGDHAGIAALARANPMTVSPRVPGSYRGELSAWRARDLGDGFWYYDPASRLLVYRYAHVEHPVAGQSAQAVFRVRLRFRDVGADGLFDPGIDTFQHILLEKIASGLAEP